MGRWTQYDEDSTRLPEGVTRIGYDADTQQYTFRGSDGSIYTSAPGNEYGHLTKISGPAEAGASRTDQMYSDHDNSIAGRSNADRDWDFDSLADHQQTIEKDVSSSWRMLAPFLLLVCLVPILAFKFLGSYPAGSPAHVRDCTGLNAEAAIVKQGDTCFDLAQHYQMSLDELRSLNEGLRCESLSIGEVVCIK